MMNNMTKGRFSLYVFLFVIMMLICAIAGVNICLTKINKMQCVATANCDIINVLNASDGTESTGGQTSETDEARGAEISYVTFGDFILYEYLMFVRDGAYPQNEEAITSNPLRENDFATLVELDLADVRDSDTNDHITDVKGLGKFNFTALKKLNLTNNNLKQINATTFAGMTNLESLNLEGNALTTLEFGNLQSVKNLQANGNALTAVDLSILAENGQASLCYNQISDIRKLNLQNDGKGASVDVYGNKINNYVSGKYQNYNLTIGFQYEYSTYNEKNSVNIYKTSGQESYYLDCVNEKTEEHIRVDNTKKLTPATYKITMCDESGALAYKVLTLKIEKSAPTFSVTDSNGNKLDFSKIITKETRINFNSNDSNYKVVYSINGADYVEGNSVTLKKSGEYSFSVYAKSDVGDDSQRYNFTVQLKIKSNNFFQTLGIIMTIFAFVIAVYGVMIFLGRKYNK